MKGLLLLNGNIYTMNAKYPKAEAVAVRDGRIFAVGKTSDIKDLGGRDFEIVNLEGKTVIPGLTDCHTHFLAFALGLRRVDLHGITSSDQLLSTIQSFSKRLRSDEWLLGTGWDKNLLGDESLFSKQTLDRIWSAAPSALWSKDQHVLWVNSKALEAAGIGRHTGDPIGGEIQRDENTGEPTGLLKEKACGLVWQKIPAASFEASRDLAIQAMRIANSYGLTGIQNHDESRAYDLFQRLQADGELTLRAAFWIPVRELDSAISQGLTSGSGDDFVRFGGVKMYADGSLGSQTALMFEPFEGSTDNLGIQATSQQELTENTIRAERAEVSVAIHAIGDRAVHQSLNSIEQSNQQVRDKGRLRHRIEHVQLLHPQDVDRFAKLGIIASVQPVHAPADMDIAERYWGRRCKFAYMFNTLLKTGAKMVFGSDAPIESIDPWRGIHAAVCRKRIGAKQSWYPEEKLTIAEAISGFTRWAAFASYDENQRGSIEVGKLADMVVLSQDPFQLDPDEIPNAKVELTILEGKIVFEQ
jgi:predicted amidohydrolase YtcJ